MRNVGIVCEGGGTKGAYTTGVLKALAQQNIYTPYCVGISSGAESLTGYVSRQIERFEVTGIGATCNPGVIGIRPLIKEHGLFGLDASCQYIEEHAPLDFDAFYQSDTAFDIGLYDMEKDEVVYYPKAMLDPQQKLIRASCALMLLAQPYTFNGRVYMDGGLIDMIPIEQSIRHGCERHIFISTKEEGYVRKPAPGYQTFLCRKVYKQYPNVAKRLAVRHLNYQKQWGLIETLRKEGNALVLRPSQDMGITRYTTDEKKLKPWFELGYTDTMDRLDEIKAFVE